jgi:glycosyltransferase involved in cell wall biosynthesis
LERGTILKIAIEARPIKWSYGTGIGNYTFSMIEKLHEIDQENNYTFLWPDNNPAPYIPFKSSYSFYSLPKDDEREAIEISLWLSMEGADLFHLPQNGFRIPATKTSKLIVTIHDLIPYFLPEMVRPSFLKRFTREMPEIVDQADHILTVSEFSKQDIVKIFGTDPNKISVVYSAPTEAYHPLPKIPTQKKLAATYGLKKPFILYAGGLNPRKNVPELIYAYSKVYRELPQLQQLVVLGGNGKHTDQLKQLVESLNLKEDIVFPGFVNSEDLPLFYNGADLFVYPSLYEGFGLPPIEAMACGTPVITSNISSIPEIVGDAAIQVNPNDTLQLAESILSVLNHEDLRTSLIQKGLKHSQNYNWYHNSAQILAVYHQVVNGKTISMAAGQ